MARKIANRPAKRANRPNPRVDRNEMFNEDNSPEFITKRRRPRYDQQPQFEPEPKSKKIELFPRNLAQEEYLDALQDETKTCVIGVGCAGTGKTYLAVLYAIQQLQQGKIKQIVLLRPTSSPMGESIGHLPGNLVEKMTPLLGSVLSIFKKFYPVKVLNKMIETEVIQIIPIAFLRGVSIEDAIIIGEEYQNVDQNVMRLTISRISTGSRLFLTGDLAQIDVHHHKGNGLLDFINKLNKAGGSPHFSICYFGKDDVERHPVVSECLRIYGEED